MFTPIQLDKMRNFRYGMKALHLIEKTLNTRIAKIDFDNLSQYEIAVLVWAGLSHEDAALNPEIVMELIDEHASIGAIFESMSNAFAGAFENGKEGKK